MKLLNLALAACVLTTLSTEANARSEPVPLPTEFSCQSDADCVTARAPCGEIRAVNKDFYGQAQTEWDRQAALVECTGLTVVPDDVPVCSPRKVCVMQTPAAR